MKFKTNIKCDGCIAAVGPVLDKAVGPSHWQVDLSDPLRVLTVDTQVVSAAQIQQVLREVGYQADEIAVA